MCVCGCARVCMHVGMHAHTYACAELPVKPKKGIQSQSWGYRWLWTTFCGCWGPNSSPPHEQQSRLTTEKSLQAHSRKVSRKLSSMMSFIMQSDFKLNLWEFHIHVQYLHHLNLSSFPPSPLCSSLLSPSHLSSALAHTIYHGVGLLCAGCTGKHWSGNKGP